MLGETYPSIKNDRETLSPAARSMSRGTAIALTLMLLALPPLSAEEPTAAKPAAPPIAINRRHVGHRDAPSFLIHSDRKTAVLIEPAIYLVVTTDVQQVDVPVAMHGHKAVRIIAEIVFQAVLDA